VPECKYHEFCDRDVEDNSAEGLCILHSTDPAKDTHAFAEALTAHRKREYGDYFIDFVFPGRVDFHETTFIKPVNFGGAIFSDEVDFHGAKFLKGAHFDGVTFPKMANFRFATFTGEASFNDAIFTGDADFVNTTFSQIAYFRHVLFSKKAHFTIATFTKEAYFGRATFIEAADFQEATFGKPGDFDGATFTKRANFFGATFTTGAHFFDATFTEEADFSGVLFSKEANFLQTVFLKRPDFSEAGFIKEADFSGATFTQGVNFIGAGFTGTLISNERQERLVKARYIFAGAKVDFRQVIINSPDAIVFIGADLTKCQFQDTDLRKVQMVAVKWPRKGQRVVVYDEIASAESEDELEDESEEGASTRPWSQIEWLYRELKQNYEDRRDYERAGDFHYGEKEMRRQNPETARGLRFFLTLYWLFSGYGERYLRPLLWAGLLFVGSTIGYMWWGLRPKDGSSSLAWTYPWINPWDWLRSAYYSFRVMTLLKPDDWVPLRYAQLVNTFQTLLGPTFLGLFALALRQRLKR
jgi:uncharacterized protein YjbI with pentapeptide repeats